MDGNATDAMPSGRVVVVAGDDPRLGEVAAAAVSTGAAVAVVSRRLPRSTAATVRFRADAADAGAWERIAMHVEQHLGPVDGVVADVTAGGAVTSVFATDLARRGHGELVVLGDDDNLEEVVTRLCGRPPAEPARPAPDARRR